MKLPCKNNSSAERSTAPRPSVCLYCSRKRRNSEGLNCTYGDSAHSRPRSTGSSVQSPRRPAAQRRLTSYWAYAYAPQRSTCPSPPESVSTPRKPPSPSAASVSTGNPEPGPIHLYLAPSPTTVLRSPSAVVPVAADMSSCSPPSSRSSKNVRQRPMSSGSRSEPRPNAASLSPPKTPSESSWQVAIGRTQSASVPRSSSSPFSPKKGASI